MWLSDAETRAVAGTQLAEYVRNYGLIGPRLTDRRLPLLLETSPMTMTSCGTNISFPLLLDLRMLRTQTAMEHW